jgi:hypothetical protein
MLEIADGGTDAGSEGLVIPALCRIGLSDCGVEAGARPPPPAIGGG